MRKLRFGMVSYIFLNLVPVTLVIPYFLHDVHIGRSPESCFTLAKARLRLSSCSFRFLKTHEKGSRTPVSKIAQQTRYVEKNLVKWPVRLRESSTLL